jgi:secreted PhoX family phosphatase
VNKPMDLPRDVFNEEDSNTSDNPHFQSVLNARLSRRGALRTSIGALAGAMLGGAAVTAAPAAFAQTATAAAAKALGFKSVDKHRLDLVAVPEGYEASVIYALGDPLMAGVPAYKNDGTDADFDKRGGDHHDGMQWYGLTSDGKPSRTATTRGLLAINHEATTDEKLSSHFIHGDGGKTSLPRPAGEAVKEMHIHGIAVVEVRKNGSKWEYVPNSPFNRRITPLTPAEISGPARGSAMMVTKYSPDGTRTRGTINNCGSGLTPWGSYISGEENWFGYFHRAADDDAKRGDKTAVALRRYGRAQGAASRHGWESAGADDQFARWNNGKTGTSANGSDDYRNEMNAQGFMLEVDPYSPTAAPRKRTGLGRFAHESASFNVPVAGQPIAAYMGDDSRNEYIYKFVSDARWDPADANPADRLAVGAKYLDKGKLYVAKFNADGSGQWMELTIDNPTIKNFAGYAFADQADVLVNCRLAADALGATKMDRPEWSDVNPKNGEVYFTLTNNSNRTLDPKGGSALLPDSANPRAYTDMKGSRAQNGNPNGHLLRLREGAGGTAATSLTWDIYLFGAEAAADKSKVNLSALTDEQDFSSPDGLWFSPYSGICWIQTDDGAYTDRTNCMMLAALPGQVGDGRKVSMEYTTPAGPLKVDTMVGKNPTPDELKRFLVGPLGAEITGITETPDGRALFVNIQHPGENTPLADVRDPSKYESHWPSNVGYGAGQRPRSATIVITKKDGGVIGT